jgi:hypothetical protein
VDLLQNKVKELEQKKESIVNFRQAEVPSYKYHKIQKEDVKTSFVMLNDLATRYIDQVEAIFHEIRKEFGNVTNEQDYNFDSIYSTLSELINSLVESKDIYQKVEDHGILEYRMSQVTNVPRPIYNIHALVAKAFYVVTNLRKELSDMSAITKDFSNEDYAENKLKWEVTYLLSACTHYMKELANIYNDRSMWIKPAKTENQSENKPQSKIFLYRGELFDFNPDARYTTQTPQNAVYHLGEQLKIGNKLVRIVGFYQTKNTDIVYVVDELER